ncbi:tumor necrosis factor receptor superfamily member 6 [Xyrichtys novacula]|uniref:Tumor necrosis factor receptor superfamily member 6 n=1 Tax=Xyrichtys novacula TaxID=13765 RepID=A0AAV1G1B5_XYRNO|nr:tumor necrosis factor receptor superfamily member 6 [Xyrichtys novacula]
MAVKTNKSWFIIFVLFFILMSISFARSQCVDGTYKHAGRDCCRCGAGSKVVEHCTENLKHGKCEPCEDGRFNSHPTGETKCEDCTFCTHPNENLEVDEPCTAARDAKCRCQPDHYCVSGTESCLLCHPCKKCGAEGIKWKCAGNNNTVCNEIKDKSQGGVIAGIIFAVIFVIAVCAGIAWFLWKKRQPSTGEPGNGNGEDEPLISKGAKGVAASQRCGYPAPHPCPCFGNWMERYEESSDAQRGTRCKD